jgi:hypothetical protein
MWLRDILPSHFAEFRVLIWGYNSNLKESTKTKSIAHFSRQLLTAVDLARDGIDMVLYPPLLLFFFMAFLTQGEGKSSTNNLPRSQSRGSGH